MKYIIEDKKYRFKFAFDTETGSHTIEGIDEDFILVATADSGQGYISHWHWESYEEVVSDNVLRWWKSFDYKIIKDNEYFALERIKSSKS